MERYERHTLEMAAKIRKQRQEIQRRSVELLNKLALQEMRKKEDKIFASPHGRMWRHHRTMQRRAFSLEPMRHDKLDTVTQSPRSKFSAMIT
ncbi:hypothetical protein DPMN_063239 [Dreissena polymorpha]|uniref:Uncharacterized protein n=1 Tax=Dreissena polymorpha TaxID=45954 RepID=A0A9D4CA50_DREPO|nr:hypothetical protein DPMN_063239 [Dreissena polymorpha]